jgi:hypothetical protein
MNCSLKLAGLWFVVNVAGCAARTHITPTQGQASSAVFASQAPSLPKVTGPVHGLDSQEAAIISSSYRHSLAPKAAEAKEEPILLVAPPSQQGGGYGMKLAPSVPSEK